MNEIEKLNACCFALINMCCETNADSMTITQEKVTLKGGDIGDWEVVVKKKK